MASTVVQPVARTQKVFVGKAEKHGKIFTRLVKGALSANEAKDKLEEKYPVVLGVWMEQRNLKHN